MDLPSPAAITRLLAPLRPFAGERPSVSLAEERSELVIYHVTWPGRNAELRIFLDRGERPLPGRRALSRANAERAGRLIYGPIGLATRLLLTDLLVIEPDRAWGVLSESPRDALALEGPPTAAQLGALAAALRRVHTNEASEIPLSGAPATLEAWWSRVVQRYRELPTSLLGSLDADLLAAIHRVLQPVAADVQAHKRFWPPAPTATVQGCPEVANIAFRSSEPIFADWYFFGLGDDSLDVVRVASSTELAYGVEPASAFKDAYREAGSGENLERRLLVYDRVWPFERVVDSLIALWPDVQHGPSQLASRREPSENTLRYCLARLLRTYGAVEEQVTVAVRGLDSWLSRVAAGAGASS